MCIQIEMTRAIRAYTRYPLSAEDRLNTPPKPAERRLSARALAEQIAQEIGQGGIILELRELGGRHAD